MKILDTFPEIVALGEGLVDAHPHAEDGRGGYDWETAAIGRERRVETSARANGIDHLG